LARHAIAAFAAAIAFHPESDSLSLAMLNDAEVTWRLIPEMEAQRPLQVGNFGELAASASTGQFRRADIRHGRLRDLVARTRPMTSSEH